MNKKKNIGIFAKISSFFFIQWRYTLMLLVFLVGSGIFIYTNVIQREGFPTIQFPLTVVNATYFVDDSAMVDKNLSQPLIEIVSELPGVKKVNTTSQKNFMSMVVEFEQEVLPATGTAEIVDAVNNDKSLPTEANFTFVTLNPGGFLNKYDMLLSVYDASSKSSVQDLEKKAQLIADEFENEDTILKAEPQPLLSTAVNPQTGDKETRQTAFNLIGLSDDINKDITNKSNLLFHTAITVGLVRDKSKIDALELSNLAKEKIASIDLTSSGDSYQAVIAADSAESVNNQISSLQFNLLTGLLAVAFVSFLLITWRASIITAIFMLSVMAVTVGILYIVGYSLNTITLFGLVLSLGLFVDDATIIVESIYANKSAKNTPLKTVQVAIKKIGSASFAGTMTTVLVFLPLAFLTGVLGEFIRLMPITVIIALLSSLILSITIIPFLSKFILLRSEKVSFITKINPIPSCEKVLSRWVGKGPGNLASGSRKSKLFALSMVTLSLVSIFAGLSFAKKLPLNIFPPSKDSDQIGIQVTYPAGYSLGDAEAVAEKINDSVASNIADVTKRVVYGGFSQSNNRSAEIKIDLVSFKKRNQTSPQIINEIGGKIKGLIPESVSYRVIQFDAGPPIDEFPLNIQIKGEDTAKSLKLADELSDYLLNTEVVRSNGSAASISRVKISNSDEITRNNQDKIISVRGKFDADDVSGLLAATQKEVEDKFTPQYLESNGYANDSLGFDFGQETENAKSFSSLAVAFPVALLLMYLLLAFQFRSLLQPLLIFMAIPFTFLGVFGGLYLTGNSLSFFVQVGLIGLIGIAVNNTILLTEYSNQERRLGNSAVEAVSKAITVRFRPLIATTLTTVVALLPLALSEPFWEALAFTIIFGLVSSTLLVLLSFPYYYIAAEWLRSKVKIRRLRKS